MLQGVEGADEAVELVLGREEPCPEEEEDEVGQQVAPVVEVEAVLRCEEEGNDGANEELRLLVAQHAAVGGGEGALEGTAHGGLLQGGYTRQALVALLPELLHLLEGEVGLGLVVHRSSVLRVCNLLLMRMTRMPTAASLMPRMSAISACERPSR